MSLTRFHLIFIGGWCTALAIVLVIRAAIGLAPTGAQLGMALLLATLPAVVILTVFRGAPDRSISQVLYDVEHAGNPTRDRLSDLGRTGSSDDRAR